MKKKLLKGMFTACCLGAMVACKPSEPAKPDISSETAEVEAKLRNFKATPTKATMDEVDRALEGMSAKIKDRRHAKNR